MLLKKIIFISLIIFSSCLIFSLNIVNAEPLLEGTAVECNCIVEKGEKIDPRCQQYCGEYGVDDFILLAKKASDIILGLSGSLALLAFIYGGIIFLISSGNNEQVTKAKGIITGAVIGLIVVFVSFTIVNFVFKGLGISDNWYESNWFEEKN